MTIPPLPPRLVVFDIDGTLVDGQHKIIVAMNEAFRRHGHPPASAADVRATIGLSLVEAVAALLPTFAPAHHEVVSRTYGDMFAILRQMPELGDIVYPGAVNTLDALQEAGFVLGIATGKSLRGVRALLGRIGMEGRFATVQTADGLPGKPDPAMLKMAMAEVGAEPERTVMIGDTTFDMAMARAAGSAGLGVAWGYHPIEALKSAGAHEIVKDFSAVAKAVNHLIGDR